jgi:arylsulfatase A-like enzyme
VNFFIAEDIDGKKSFSGMIPKTNVVLITVDSLRSDYLGQTPFLDKLAKSSLVYQNAIVPSLPTFFCFPSLMNGQLPFKHGHLLGIPAKTKTIAQVLKNNGYLTLAFVADNPSLYSSYGYDQGFEHFFNLLPDIKNEPSRVTRLAQNLERRLPKKASFFLQALRQSFFPPGLPSALGQNLNQKTKKFFKVQKPAGFFLWLHYMDVHAPYFPGMDSYFRVKTSGLKGRLAKAVFYYQLTESSVDMKIKSSQFLEKIKAVYRAAIRYEDKIIKDIYNFLKSHYPQTIFIITSDHGEAFMEHGLYFHEPFSLYDELIKVPLIINLPNQKGRLIKETVSLLSLPRTISSLLSVKASCFQGTDITKKTDHPLNHLSTILYQCRAPHLRLQIFDNQTPIKGFDKLWSYTDQDYKYILNQATGQEEFYELKKDPEEKINLGSKNKKAQAFKKKLLKYC